MDRLSELLRGRLEACLVHIAKENFPGVSEIWYNPTHLDPDGRDVEEECYLFINQKYDFKLDDAFTTIELEMFRDRRINIAFLQMPFNPGFQRRVYPREA